MIEFLCPNGHKIRCPDAQAGRAAKCPKCQVRFRVPDPKGGGRPAGGAVGKPADDKPELSVASETSPDEGEPGDTIEFLCPNGHRLHGPARLQGHPGECPTCGTKFRVPTYEDLSGEDVPDQPIEAGRADREEDFEMVLPEVDDDDDSERHAANAFAERLAAAKHPTAELLSRMWEYKKRGATLEIRLSSGETLIPDFFAAKSAASTHALLAAVERDSTHTVYLVAWDAVQRVLLRGVKSLPEEFES